MLRETLGYSGTKIACDYGGCGACTVLMDGKVCRYARRITLGAPAPALIRATMVEQAIKGKAINAAAAKSAAEAAITGAIPPAMNAYKVEITKALVKRIILA